MEIRTIRYFLAIAKEENRTKAAEILHVTQPTRSKTLRALDLRADCGTFPFADQKKLREKMGCDDTILFMTM